MPKKQHKDRLTITLKKDVLGELDKFIDGEKIRNRSHAIEYILGRYLGTGVSTCVILASGKPEHNRAPLLRVKNRPIIAYTIERLRLAGITRLIIVVNDDNAEVEHYLKEGTQWNMDVTYVKDSRGTGTAHSLNLVRDYINQTFLLIYGDVLTDIDFQQLIRYHIGMEDNAVTLAVTACANPTRFGVTELQGNRVYEIMNQPSHYKKSSLVYSGISVLEPSIFQHIDSTKNKYLVKDILPVLAHRGMVAGYPFTEKWFNVSYKQHFKKAQTEWIN